MEGNNKRRRVNKYKPSLIANINIKSILELDILNILYNDNLRHEIIHSKSLQFKSLNNSKKSDLYWKAIEYELEFDCSCLVFDDKGQGSIVECKCHNGVQPKRIPIMIRNIRDILINLLEKSNKADSDRVNELTNELLDDKLTLSQLFKSLSEILKKHCAPIRDSLIDRFLSTSFDNLTQSLELFLTLLEQMKIDILNHQLIAHRQLILQSAIEIEFQYFEMRRQSDELSIENTINCLSISKGNTIRETFFLNVLQQLQSNGQLPETLLLDKSKLDNSHQQIQDLTLISLLLLLARQTLNGFNSSSLKQFTVNELQELKSELFVILNNGKIPSPLFKTQQNNKGLTFKVVDLIQSSSNQSTLFSQLSDKTILMALTHITRAVNKKLGYIDSSPSTELLQRLKDWFDLHYNKQSNVYHLIRKRLYDNLTQQILEGFTTISSNLNEPCVIDILTISKRLSNILDFNYKTFEGLYAKLLNTSITSDIASSHKHKQITKSQAQGEGDNDTDNNKLPFHKNEASIIPT
ncbi:hypothetical protein E3Q22_04052 [Wallemia mellicola]|uniref:Uncharacterized protein n=1 Tax=Wallemia mellicola TaxID=1708541 RepID=A0A4T0LXX8_9BASI|nr:hypothetical protein E3Q24_03933 [Wallemia mellicola]TIB75071.1 hypothetical protein E3Q22_04052 [Wallemia mellicola]TIB96188.1 hypothetical protein E3Q17_03965 [Wallemia mellicola]TIC12788.1 hypothetical protein E3Q13_04098 [Wallemia mellicola]TIC19958.1 hypothetical protein E3Q12_04026 [Wallemia mellicola]